MEQDRSRHAVCRLKTALRLLAGTDVQVPARAFPAYSPSRIERGLQMANSAAHLTRAILPNHTVVSGASLAYLTGELEYSGGNVVRLGFRYLAAGQPFFLVPGNPQVSLQHEIGCDANPQPRIRFCSQCVVIVIGNYEGVPAVFRVGACDESRAEVSRQAAGIRLAQLIPSFQKLAPRQLAEGRSPSGFDFAIETAVGGDILPFSWKRVDAVSELCLANACTKILARPLLARELAQVCESLPANRDALMPIADALLRWHSDSPMAGCLIHGDLWLGNILFSGDEVTGIVDWEWVRPDGFPFVDALHLLLMSYSVDRQVGIAETLRAVWTDTVQDYELNQRLAAVARRFGFLGPDLKFATLTLWFNYLRERVIRGRMPSQAWAEDMLARTMPSINTWLKAYERGTSEAASRPRTARIAISRL